MFSFLLAGPCSFTALVMFCVSIALVAVDIDQLSFLRLDFPECEDWPGESFLES